jgi:hypothetical protein
MKDKLRLRMCACVAGMILLAILSSFFVGRDLGHADYFGATVNAVCCIFLWGNVVVMIHHHVRRS